MSWSTNPVAPVKQTGKGWFESGTDAPAPVKGGWFALLEKVAPFKAEGNLSAVVSPRRFERVSFSGSGKLTPVLNPRNYRNAAFSGNGLPTAEMVEVRHTTANFSGSGKLDLNVPLEDGLHASMKPGLAARFSGGGGLVVVVEGGRPPVDGLYADMIGRYFIPAYFASQGDFVAFIGVLQIALADMIGSGALTADVKQIHPRLAQFAANGQLSVSIVRGAAAIAQLLGTGTLSAQAFARYLSSVGVSGGGALTALLKASYTQTADSGGTGTMAALVMQRYLIDMSGGGNTPPFSSEGTLSATMVRTIEIINRSAALTSSGNLSATLSKLDPPYVDTFDRANSYDLGTLWTPRVSDFQLYLNGAYGNGNQAIESYVGTMRTNDMEAWITLAGLHGGGTSCYVYVGIGHNEAGQGVWGYFDTSSGTNRSAQIGTVSAQQWSTPTAWQGSVKPSHQVLRSTIKLESNELVTLTI